jgi:hypothetical protein
MRVNEDTSKGIRQKIKELVKLALADDKEVSIQEIAPIDLPDLRHVVQTVRWVFRPVMHDR